MLVLLHRLIDPVLSLAGGGAGFTPTCAVGTLAFNLACQSAQANAAGFG